MVLLMIVLFPLGVSDKVTPYLPTYFCCVDGFSSLINEAARNQMMSSISICRGCPMVTHMFFADDTLLFCKASTQECQKLNDILQLYEAASG